jgi:hypothetical protein
VTRAGRFASTFVPLALALGLWACSPGAAPRLLPVSHQTAEVNSTLRVPLDVDNPRGVPLVYRFVATSLVAIESIATISGSPSGGEFRFTPLASHVGTHSITFILSEPGGSEYDRQDMIVDVTAAADAAPVFLEPGAGGTFDLERDPCVRFHVEIRDDDSTSVDVRERSPLPDGAMLAASGPKSSDFAWCPTPDQIGASARWTIELEADDLDHPPVPHDFVAVLRTGTSTGCPGLAPVITLTSPLASERVPSSTGYDVVITATDDRGLRDAPLLYWTTERPVDPAAPDVTTYAQASFVAEGAGFRARVPTLGLAEGEEREVFFTVSATDNDDATGTACDHRTDLLPVVSFFAVGGAGGGTAMACDPCTASVECASGICAPAAGGARCLDACTAAGSACAHGTCASVSTTEGAPASACGDVAAACSGSAGCTDDAFEDDDSVAAAHALASGAAHFSAQICSNDDDYYAITPAAMDRVTVALAFTSAAGDLDLQLLDSLGTIVGSSAGTSDAETVSYCARSASPLYARVLGYSGAENAYTMDVTRAAGACCVDDAFEPDDTQATARAITGTDFDGTLCASDDDWIRLVTTGAAHVVVDLTFDLARADVDMELVGASGTVIASSLGTTDTEHIDAMVATAGTYAIHVFSLDTAMSNDYLGMVTVTARATCTSTLGCPAGQICDTGACRSGTCTTASMCPATYLCPDAGPGTGASTCGASCTVNGDCRSGEACKRFPEGRACEAFGTGANGASCASFADCGGQRACLDWPGGYCARARCMADSDCETGTFCVTVAGGTNVCSLDCTTDATRCHAGITCRAITGVGGTPRHVCAP